MKLHQVKVPLSLLSSALVILGFPTLRGTPQVVPDSTLSTQVDQNNVIRGGKRVGNNLFHSFEEFSIPSGGQAVFATPPNITIIFSRVTGSNSSIIDGSLRAGGTADLFLINPNGIQFGPEVTLEIGGSLVVTTAENIQFQDGKIFSAKNLEQSPLLTISVPVGLQFGSMPGAIEGKGVVDNEAGTISTLSVAPGNTLALIGGRVSLDRFFLFPSDGNLEVSSVSGNQQVSVAPDIKGWSFGYEGVEAFDDVQVNESFLFVQDSGQGSGDIHLQGANIRFANGGEIGLIHTTDQPSGTLSLRAAETLEVDGAVVSSFFSGAGKVTDIILEGTHIDLKEGATVTARPAEGATTGGNVTLLGHEQITLSGGESLTQVTTATAGGGDSGTLTVKTPILILQNGGALNAGTFEGTEGDGSGGRIFIEGKNVEVSGSGFINGQVVPSAISAETSSDATGSAGSIEINLTPDGQLLVRNGGLISTTSTGETSSEAGSLTIRSGDITISGKGSGLFASSVSAASVAGDIILEVTNRLLLENGATVQVNGLGGGEAGDITITASRILLSDNSSLNTDARLAGSGGNITINSKALTLVAGSEITAQAVRGMGGNITITTPNLSQSPSSTISANSTFGTDGVVSINNTLNGILIPFNTASPDLAGVPEPRCGRIREQIARGLSGFYIVGRGGIRTLPGETASSDTLQANWVTVPEPKTKQQGKEASSWEELAPRFARARARNAVSAISPTTIVEAQGWQKDANGNLVLVSQISGYPQYVSQADDVSCSAIGGPDQETVALPSLLERK